MADRSPKAGPVAAANGAGQTDDGFRGPQVCTLIGITYRQLDYWARTGLLRPSIADARGSGTQRRYSYHDVLELKVIKQLLDAGISLQRARRAIECMRQGMGGDLAAANLVLVGTSSVLAHSDGEVVDLLKGGQGVLNIVPLSGVVEELNADILRIERESHVVAVSAPATSPATAAEATGG
jgi:DNA-binding transcriptional MerR regulator